MQTVHLYVPSLALTHPLEPPWPPLASRLFFFAYSQSVFHFLDAAVFFLYLLLYIFYSYKVHIKHINVEQNHQEQIIASST